ncbi:MAG: DUF2779 domain-containing protein [Candidatus Margulisiibacteriota bacterium]
MLPVISKTNYFNDGHCPRLTWRRAHQPAGFPRIDSASRFIMENGTRVGELARKLYPNGILLRRLSDPAAHVAQSREALLTRKPVFEAGFIHGGAYALSDILVPVGENEWDICEVKSTTNPDEHHIEDVAFQRFVCEGAGLKIRRCYIVYLNKGYVLDGEIDPQKLFSRQDVTPQTLALLNKYAPAVNSMQTVVGLTDEPPAVVGPHCFDPRVCSFVDECIEGFGPDHVLSLARGKQKAFELMRKGIHHLADIPASTKLSPYQKIQVEAHRSGKPHIDLPAIQAFLQKFTYPLYFLDFETLSLPWPVYPGCRPNAVIPFQYSLHVVSEPGAKPIHSAFIAEGRLDPRPELIRTLRALLGTSGSIVAYNAGFEQSRLKEMAAAIHDPDLVRWVASVIPRFVDELKPFSEFNYYHPGQGGSASIKHVLPVVSDLSYKDMLIGNGGLASAEFYRVTFGEGILEADRQQVRDALLRYCEQDTYAMIVIYDFLQKLVANS